MSSDLKARKDASIAESLFRAGLGQAYHPKSRSLKELGEAGAALIALLDAPDFRAGIGRGQGFNLQCRTHKSFDSAYLLTRAMRLSKVDVRVAGLIDLLAYHDAPPEKDWARTRFQDFEAAQALVIPRFYEAKFQPLPGPKVQQLEWWLTQRMDDGLSVSVQYQGDLAKQEVWSPYFVEMLSKRNEKVELA